MVKTYHNHDNSKHLFLRHNLKGCPEKLKQTAYTFFDSLFYGVWHHCLGPIPKIQQWQILGSGRFVKRFLLDELAPNDTTYKRLSCHIRYKLLCKLCRNLPPPAMSARLTVFLGRAGHACPLNGRRCSS